MYKENNPVTWHELIDKQKAHIADMSSTLPSGQTHSPDLADAQNDLNKMLLAQLLEPSWERVIPEEHSSRPVSSRLPFALDARSDCIISPGKIVYQAQATKGFVEKPLLLEAIKYIASAWRGDAINIHGSDDFKKMSWAVAQIHDVKVANYRLKGQDDMPRVSQLKIAHGILTGFADGLRTFRPDTAASPLRPGGDGLSGVVTRIYRL